MAAPNYDNVTVGSPKVGGAIFVAPKGTALPTDATTALASAYVCVGAITEDGVKRSHSMETTKHFVWGGDVAEISKNKYDETMTFGLAELDADGMKLAWGADKVSTASGMSFVRSAFNNAENIIVIESVLKNGKVRRDVTPRAVVIGIGDEVLKDDTLVSCDLEFGCMADTTIGGCSKTYTGTPASQG